MTEIDYQTALLLQYKYEQENKDSKLARRLQGEFEKENKPNKENQSNAKHLSDSIIAKSLQDQFQNELEVERPGNNLVYEPSTSGNQKQATKSLTDPSWEVIDPTPDIHNLFMVFNQRFFWNQLGSVCVGWSKRMTTCAGICSYQGRGGMCTITLSEPLLKLRPRKDLVETLLHEMIHAYLFVTNNNRDRDGHGPEFHRHMNRINNEAGTHITVYHNFHDEVNLYKQHWWRCDGPCQKRRPYFGLVRRATNRAPGPNDFWWGEHSRTCGGQFIKVKEPEKPVKSTKKAQTESTSTSPDIRKFFPTNKSATPITGTVRAAKSKSSITATTTVKTVNGNNEPASKINKVFSNSNIFGFENLNDDSTCNGTNKKKQSNTKNKKPFSDNKPSSSTGKKLNSYSVSSGDYSVVRNHWANKFSNKTTSNPELRPQTNLSKNTNNDSNTNSRDKKCESGNTLKSSSINEHSSEIRNHWINKFPDTGHTTERNKVPQKRLSVDLSEAPSEKIAKVLELYTDCPVCSKKVAQDEINNHLDICLEKGHLKDCYICGIGVPQSDFQRHINSCMEDSFTDDVFDDSVKESDSSVEIIDQIEIAGSANKTNNRSKMKKCDICNESVQEENFDLHASDCLHKMFDSVEARSKDKRSECQSSANSKIIEGRGSNDSKVECLACKRNISKADLNEHLEECMSLSNIFDNDSEPVEGESDTTKMYNCPCCMKLFSEVKMNDHIDICLN